MIITCVCGEKKFNIPDGSIPVTGRMVQCGYCDKEWKQFPVVVKEPKVVKLKDPVPIKSAPSIKKGKPKKTDIKKSPVPYSKEYMQQKWGTSFTNSNLEKKLSKKQKILSKVKKTQKEKIKKIEEKPSFGFFNYTIVFFVFSTFFIGILNFERARISRKFPVLEPYIDHFFETIEIFKILILDFFR